MTIAGRITAACLYLQSLKTDFPSQAEGMATFTRKAIAEICGISPQRIKQLFDEGVLGRNDDGRYPESALTQYIAYLDRDAWKESKFRKLLDQERHRELKRDNDAAESLVAPVEQLEKGIEDAVAAMVPILNQLPELVKKHLPELTEDQAKMVEQSVADCRRCLGDVALVTNDE